MRAFLLAALFAVPASAAPALRPERIVLRTDAGDLVLALYAAAPKHAAKLLALFRAGAYDGAPVTKIDALRFAAIASAPGTKASRLPVESGGPHRAGVIAMAHQRGDPDAGETAFIILFAGMPSMDGSFSSVGEVAGGQDVLEALRAAPVDAESRPARPLAIRGSMVLASEAALAKTALRGPDRAALGLDDAASRRRALLLFGILAFALGAGLWLKGKPVWSSAGLLACLAGYFAAFAALADYSASHPGLAVLLFASTVGVFRLMGRFER